MARLATVSAAGRPHLVPVCFVLVEDVVYSAVDEKPKRSTVLRRVTNIHATGVAALLVDYYVEDWTRLWWVRADGRARLVDDGDVERQRALAALAAKYRQYRQDSPPGPVLALDATRWAGWESG